MSYKNKSARNKYSQGSQSEIPTLVKKGNNWNVDGYQQFTITPQRVILKPNLYFRKFSIINNLLQKAKHIGITTLHDIGCSNGLVCFLAAYAGISHVKGLDHDLECLDLINTLAKNVQKPISTCKYSFGDNIEPQDMTVAGALVHWVYSCTASFGSLDLIIEYLRSITNKILLIEWVDPQDVAIKKFQHINFQINKQKEPYNLQHFEAALKKHFVLFKKVFYVNSTRWFYVAVTQPEYANAFTFIQPSAHKTHHPVINKPVVKTKQPIVTKRRLLLRKRQ